MEPERPVVTITDPNAPPLGTADVLDQGREGWRPDRYQKALAALAAAVVALVCAAVAGIRHIDHDRALDRASVRGLSLAASIDPGQLDPNQDVSEPDPVVTLANLANGAVTLLSLRVGDASVPVPAHGFSIPSGASFIHALPATPCTPRSGRATRREITAEIRTERGQRVTQHFTLDAGQLFQPNRLERMRCRTLLPDEAFGVSVLGIARDGSRVTFTAAVENISLLTLRVLEVEPLPGLTAAARGLPLDLAPARPGLSRLARVSVSLRMVDCQAFARYLVTLTGEDPALFVRLHGQWEDGMGSIPLFLGATEGYENLMGAIVAACPVLAMGDDAHALAE